MNHFKILSALIFMTTWLLMTALVLADEQAQAVPSEVESHITPAGTQNDGRKLRRQNEMADREHGRGQRGSPTRNSQLCGSISSEVAPIVETRKHLIDHFELLLHCSYGLINVSILPSIVSLDMGKDSLDICLRLANRL